MPELYRCKPGVSCTSFHPVFGKLFHQFSICLYQFNLQMFQNLSPFSTVITKPTCLIYDFIISLSHCQSEQLAVIVRLSSGKTTRTFINTNEIL